MKRITIVKALAVLAVVPSLALVTSTSKHTVPAVYASLASTGCSSATLTGNYAVIQPAGLTSRALPTTSGIVPWQYAGVVNFDGQGTFTLDYTAAVNNAVDTGQSAGGTYTVASSGPNSECSGTLTITKVAVGTPVDVVGTTANIYIVGGGAEAFGIITNQGNTATFDAKKQ